jgi:hypothetical protein
MRSAFRFARAGQSFDGVVENVRESFCQPLHRLGRSVHVYRRICVVRKRPDVIDAVDVVGMVVREENGRYFAHASGDKLKAQLGRCIDEDVRPIIRLDECAYSGPLISRIGRPAHVASTANLGDTKTGSRPQKGEFQTVSTLSKLVVPGMSKGTPAVTMMRSPFDASSLATTTDLARAIIWS